MPARLSIVSLITCFLRSNMVNVAYNLRGLQNIGFTYSMLPGLRVLYPDDKDFAAACRRYAIFHNCHPFWTTYLTGAFLEMEKNIAAGRLDPDQTAALKETLLNSLSAIGDSFFSGSLNIACFLILACLTIQGGAALACAGLLFWLPAAIAAKIFLFCLGFSRGFQVVAWLPRLNLINAGDYLKIACALLLLLFLALAMRIYTEGAFAAPDFLELLRRWVVPLGLLVGFSYVSARLHYPRGLLLALLLAFAAVL